MDVSETVCQEVGKPPFLLPDCDPGLVKQDHSHSLSPHFFGNTELQSDGPFNRKAGGKCRIQVSVILPVYNAEFWLDECLKSVLDQDFQGSIELSVFNDSSTDNSINIIKKWKILLEEAGIPVVVGENYSTHPGGVGFAKNCAIDQSSGEYLCFLDSDDVMMPQRIRLQWEANIKYPRNIIGCQIKREPAEATQRYTRWINNLTHDQLLTQVWEALPYTEHDWTEMFFIQRKYRRRCLQVFFGFFVDGFLAEMSALAVLFWTFQILSLPIDLSDIEFMPSRHSPDRFLRSSKQEEFSEAGKKGSIESPTSALQELNTESGIMDLQTIRSLSSAPDIFVDDMGVTGVFTSHGPTVIMPTWFCSREWFYLVGRFNEGGKGTPEDLLFFYEHLRKGGEVFRVDQCLLLYRYHAQAASTAVLEETIWTHRVLFLEERILSNWTSFTIWNAGKQGRKLFRSLSPANQNKVTAFCDVDKNKITKAFYIYEESKEPSKPRIPILHFKEASPPLIICVKLDLTDGQFEENLSLLNLKEGVDYYHFN